MDRNFDMKMDMDLMTATNGTRSAGHGSMQTLGSDELYRHPPVNPYFSSIGMKYLV